MQTPSQTNPTFWDRAIILVDMNAFFAAIEQRDHPELRGQPVAITNGEEGTCIITCSYEARAYGIKTGMRLREALQRCPRLIRLSTRPDVYAQTSCAIMESLETITPDIEVFSVDEAFLDVTHCQKLWGNPEIIGRLAQQKIYQTSGLLCSIGISGDKTTAKYAAKLKKPNGFTLIPPWEAKECLRRVPVTELCGIGEGISHFLARYGVTTCGDMEKLPISILGKRFGNLGRRIWLMCQGADPEPIHIGIADPKSMGHGKVMPPNTRDKHLMLTYLRHMSEKLAARLRQHAFQAQHFYVGWRTQDWNWLGSKSQLTFPGDDGKAIYDLGREILTQVWHGESVCQIQVTALDPKPAYLQEDFWQPTAKNRQRLNQVVDAINQRYGEFTVAPTQLLQRSRMHNVIAPAWKPEGHRRTI